MLGPGAGGFFSVAALLALMIIVVSTIAIFASRYKRCPSDQILVIFGSVGKGKSSLCIHGGGQFVWPLFQDYQYLSLVPMTISIPLKDALSLQNIRVNVPSTFTVGVSTEPEIMQNAAERLLHLPPPEIEQMAREIIFGQLRLTVASLSIEQINQDRERFLAAVRQNVAPELNKIGLYLINVNITDITDTSDYIESIGKKAAAEAINRAKVDVAEQEKLGDIGHSEALRERMIQVARNEAESTKGQKQAEADRRIFVQRQESQAAIGEAEANREKSIQLAVNQAEAEKGRKQAEADQRVYVQSQEATAVSGENQSKAKIAEAQAELAVKQAEAHQRMEVAKRQAQIAIQKAQYEAETERLIAEEIAQEEVEKRKVEISAEAAAEKRRREARGDADAVLAKYEAEAKGIRQVLESKAQGYASLVNSCSGDARSAATLLMIEKLEDIVGMQVEAIRNLKIDKVTVWDSGSGANGGSSTSNFASSLIRSIPPLHDVAKMAGVELPEYLGTMDSDEDGESSDATEKPSSKDKRRA